MVNGTTGDSYAEVRGIWVYHLRGNGVCTDEPAVGERDIIDQLKAYFEECVTFFYVPSSCFRHIAIVPSS